MSTIVRVQQNGLVTIPMRLRSRAGLCEGDLLEAAFERGRIVLTPKAEPGGAAPPVQADEYTPAQRRSIERGIARSLAEYKQGRSLGPFATPGEFIASLRKEARKLQPRKRKRASQ